MRRDSPMKMKFPFMLLDALGAAVLSTFIYFGAQNSGLGMADYAIPMIIYFLLRTTKE